MFKRLWENLLARFITIFALVNVCYFLLKESGLLSLKGSGILGIIAVLIATIVLAYVSYIVDMVKTEGISSDPDDSAITKHLRERIGTVFSLLTPERRFIDYKHEYQLLLRQDLLDYQIGHYNSFRRIKGINKSNTISDGIIYCESTEFKIPFTETKIVAVDVSTGEQLRVEPLKDIHELCITHAFKIHFSQPIRPNEDFDIAYSIYLPNELKCLDSNDEIMSISLARIKKPVKELEFNVCLSFKPRAIKVFEKSKFSGSMRLVDAIRLEASEYIPVTNLEKNYNIDWSCGQPYIIRWKCNNPSSILYVIEYIR